MTHALPDQANKTKFKLIYANVSEDDILLRKELDALKAKYPNTFDVVYLVDKANPGWTGGVGFVNQDFIKQHVGPADLKEKVKVFICGTSGSMYNALLVLMMYQVHRVRSMPLPAKRKV